MNEWVQGFFRSQDSDFPFDIFAASFYLITRYEEYLPHRKDAYGRYAHENSPRLKKIFSTCHGKHLGKRIRQKTEREIPTFNYQPSTFNFLPTYDIDIAWSYKHKGLLRNLEDSSNRLRQKRWRVLAGIRPDPFDSYNWLHELHATRYQLDPVYFFLVAGKNGQCNKNILPHNDSMWKLIRQHATRYTVGLHPSMAKQGCPFIARQRKKQLEAMSGLPVQRSRQHYIRFSSEDTTEGYWKRASQMIIRWVMEASTASGLRWLLRSIGIILKRKNKRNRIHPFCFMDANSLFLTKQNTEQTWTELDLYNCMQGKFRNLAAIWHNNF